MAYRVYREIDKPYLFFGIKSSYLPFLGIGMGVSLLIGVAVGTSTQFLFGFVAFACCGVVVYVYILNLQSKYSEKNFPKVLDKGRLPRKLRVPSVPLRTLFCDPVHSSASGASSKNN